MSMMVSCLTRLAWSFTHGYETCMHYRYVGTPLLMHLFKFVNDQTSCSNLFGHQDTELHQWQSVRKVHQVCNSRVSVTQKGEMCNGDCIFYKWKHYGNQGERPLSCSQGFHKHSPDTTWVIGASVDVNDVNIMLTKAKADERKVSLPMCLLY